MPDLRNVIDNPRVDTQALRNSGVSAIRVSREPARIIPARPTINVALSSVTTPTHRVGGAIKSLPPSTTHRKMVKLSDQAKQSIAAKTIRSTEVPQEKRLHAEHSLKQVRERPTCKERPDNTNRTRGNGTARREFVPWCSRRS